MTKQLEDVLNLPRLEDAIREAGGNPEDFPTESEVDKLADALEGLNPADIVPIDEDGTLTLEREMNDIYGQALKAHKDMMDLAFNMEPKNAGSIMAPAARMLEIAMQASQNKSEHKLKTMKARIERAKLEMDREKHDHDLRKNVTEGTIESTNSVDSILADRNELMKKLRDQRNQD